MSNPLHDVIRTTNKSLRAKLDPAFVQECSLTICQRIQEMDVFKQAQHIALYQAFAGEIDLKSLWEIASNLGKDCYFPALNKDKTLGFLPAKPGAAFKSNQYGILEPDVSRQSERNAKDLDLIILPLVAFDDQGNRLGMGAGYYDRTLSQVQRPFLLGAAYEFQRRILITANPWDIPLNAVITEKHLYNASSPTSPVRTLTTCCKS